MKFTTTGLVSLLLTIAGTAAQNNHSAKPRHPDLEFTATDSKDLRGDSSVPFKEEALLELPQGFAVNSKSRNTRVWNGHLAGENEFPFYTLLVTDGSYHCGGNLVAPDMVLTAGHCNPKVGTNLYVGATKRDGAGANGQFRLATTTLKHPNYDLKEDNNGFLTVLNHDFALVKLSSPVLDIDYVDINTDASFPVADALVTAVGMGKTRYDQELSQSLLKTTLRLTSSCTSGIFDDLGDQMCATADNTDVCGGDSGGPLLAGGKLVGLTSYGPGCGYYELHSSSVFAEVSGAEEWIKEQVCALSDHKPEYCDLPACLDSPRDWHDSDGYKCEWYAQDDNCQQAGDYFANNGVTANQACCTCGGGSEKVDSVPPSSTNPAAPTRNPTPPPAGGDCLDSPRGWHDRAGEEYNCEWYAQDDNCQEFGDDYENNGVTANQACCTCGGGSEQVDSVPPSSTNPVAPTQNPTPPPAGGGCLDSPNGWYDSFGDNCEWYAQDYNCQEFGAGFENNGITANQACCTCGGGSEQVDSVTPTISPLLPVSSYLTAPLHFSQNINGIKDSFYTTDFSVSQDVLLLGYAYHGVIAHVSLKSQPGLSPLYSYFNGLDHFYTTSPPEALDPDIVSVYDFEGVVCYVSTTPQDGLVPFNRYIDADSGDNFYSIDDWPEGSGGYSFVEVAAYVRTP